MQGFQAARTITVRWVVSMIVWMTIPPSPGGAEVRSAQVAGQFYPAEPQALRSMIQELWEAQPAPQLAVKPRLLILPHAGYPYSGQMAARGFKEVQGKQYQGVVVVGFTHRFPFAGVSVDDRQAYETPLGRIPIDQEAAAFLRSRHARIRHEEGAHASGEHSMEVMLPFLQVALGDFKLVPILMGTSSLGDARVLAEALAALAERGDYLFIFSTDLSHYHPDEEAKRIDERTIAALLFETPQAVNRLFEADQLEACGRGPILAALSLGNALGYLQRHLLGYANSGDTSGDRSAVVGYAAIAMTERPPLTEGRFSHEAGMALVKAARLWLEETLGRDGGASDPAVLSERVPDLKRPELQRSAGVFVTLRKHGELRGCIGNLQADKPLAQVCPIVAVESATQDPRFSPVRKEELAELQVEVALLTPPQPLTSIEELVPGRDGVILEHEGRRGVFLPVVWEETAWTRMEFLRELARQKAGLPPDAWRQAQLSVFQDQVFME